MSWCLVCARRAWPRCSASTVAGPVLPVLLFTMRAILPRRAWRSGCICLIFSRCSSGQTVGQCVAVYVHALRELTAIQPGAEHTGHQLHGAGHFVDAFEQGNFV